MTSTKEEQIQAVYDLKAGYTLGHADIAILKWLARIALAGMEAEPVGVTDKSEIECLKRGEMANVMPPDYKGCDSGDSVYLYDAPQPLTTSERSELENYRNAQQVDSSGMRRDALRYRFLRDKDAFGDEDEPDLAGWDGLSELDGNAFDSAVDARILQSGIPLYTASEKQVIPADADVYAELHRLRAEIKGPDGFDTWKDAAIFERTARIKLGRIAQEIDYLTAMAAYHSEQWHKMSPITGYMNGWNACRAAMLQGKADGTLTNEVTIPATQFKPVADLYGITSPTGSETSFTFDAVEARDFIDGGWTCQEYVELERFQDAMTNHSGDTNEKVNSPVVQDGYCIMPTKLTAGNGAKGALSGEFHVTHRIICQSCGGEGCEDCNEDGGWDAEIPIGWDTIKRIHEAAVESCALPAAPKKG